MVAAAYIHIPFCSHKCDFCDFAAVAGLDHLEDEYIGIVCDEIEQRLSKAKTQPLVSVFYGGGTPGLVRPESLARIHERLKQFCTLTDNAEVTLETTPHSITADKVRSWRAIGINRISIGVESLDDQELRSIGRDHSEQQAYEGIRLACTNGFDNVSCDFMYSLPTQTTATWTSTLAKFLQQAASYPQIKHVSAYGLHLSNNSPIFSRFPKDSPSFPDDESFEQMYHILVETLEGSGFYQYEVSNFAQPGHESVHNYTYWQNAEYYGFGVSAHRYVDRVRSSNWRSLAKYMKDCMGSETCEVIDDDIRLREAIMLGLRTRSGIDLSAFALEFGTEAAVRLRKPAKRLLDLGVLQLVGERLTITQKGVPISNSIIAELI